MKLRISLMLVLFATLILSSMAAEAPSQREFEHLGQCHIIVEIDGVISAPFQSVEGLESVTQVIEYREGTGTKSPKKMPGVTIYSNIILKREYTYSSELWQWRKKVVDGNADRRNGTITLAQENRGVTVHIKLHGAWPVRWKLTTHEGRDNVCLIEELEIVVDKIELHLSRPIRRNIE